MCITALVMSRRFAWTVAHAVHPLADKQWSCYIMSQSAMLDSLANQQWPCCTASVSQMMRMCYMSGQEFGCNLICRGGSSTPLMANCPVSLLESLRTVVVPAITSSPNTQSFLVASAQSPTCEAVPFWVSIAAFKPCIEAYPRLM